MQRNRPGTGNVTPNGAIAGNRTLVRSFPAWRDAIQGLFPGFDPQAGDRERFLGEFARRAIGDLGLTEMGANRFVMAHDRLDARAAARPGCCLVLQIAGRARMSQAGRDATLLPGDLTLIDGTQPARFVYDQPYRQLAMQLPHQAVTGRLGRDLPTARLLAGNQSVPAMMREMVISLFGSADKLNVDHGLRLGDTILDLLGVALEQGGSSRGVTASHRNATQMAAIRHYIDRHIADPELSPLAIAREHGVSLRQLHRLFSSSGSGVGEWLLRRRLEHCHADLRDPALAHLGIGDIAIMRGFNGFSHFSRTFRERYGVSPREFRLRK